MSSPTGEKYVLDRRLGGGGMAEVYLARTVGAEGFSRPVAVKRVLPGYSENPLFASLFVSEAQISSRLQHPNIVSILDFDRDRNGQLFLVMELVDGIDLDGLLATGPLPYSAIAYVTAEVLRGLGHAHDLPSIGDGVRGVIHRDVSPHNVLLSWTGAVKVSDFGIAKARSASNATATEMVKGKPAYMSPEQANGEQLDGRSDLFAVGVMVWEMLCARPLFAGATTQETLARLLFAPVAPPRTVRPDVPPMLERIAMGLLARDRAQRYQTAEAAIAELVTSPEYPRDGRELLAALLAERCPGRSPKRAQDLASPDAMTRVSQSKFAPAVVPYTPIPGPRDASPSMVSGLEPPASPPQSRRGRVMTVIVLAALLTTLGIGFALRDRDSAPASAAAPDAVDAKPPTIAIDALDQAAVGTTDAASALGVPDAGIDASVSPPDATPDASGRRIPKREGKDSKQKGMEEVDLGGG